MLTRKMIIEELKNRGYAVTEHDVIKNGVTLHGIMFENENGVNPTLYTEDINTEDINAACDALIKCYEKHKETEFNPESLKNPAFIFSNARIALQRKGKEDLIKRNCPFSDEIEEYLYIKVKVDGVNGAVKINKKQLVELTGFSDFDIHDLWKKAEENTAQDTTLESLNSVIFSILSDEHREELEKDLMNAGEPVLYVLSNKERYKGAAGILNKDLLKAFADRFGVSKIFAIPSSIHEFLIMPFDERFNMGDLSSLVKSVNSSDVAAEDQLADNAFILNVA